MSLAQFSTGAPSLVGDVGGTNARFALTSNADALTSVRVLPCDRYPSLSDAILDYLAWAGNPRTENAVIAIATPVLGDHVRMTNHHWSFSIEATRQQFGFRSLLVINDFFALAMSLPFLSENQRQRLDMYGQLQHGVKAVIGPGTGLGVAGLVPFGAGWQPVASEGGHVSFAPADLLELELLQRLWRNHPHVSAERLLSGPGILLLYRTLCEMAGVPPGADEAAGVVQLSRLGQCKVAEQTVALFSGLLGGVAGNVALTYGCIGGLYLGGGIVGKLGDQFDREKFCQRFVAKGRFESYLESIPRWLITAEYPAFIGAAQHLRQHLAQLA